MRQLLPCHCGHEGLLLLLLASEGCSGLMFLQGFVRRAEETAGLVAVCVVGITK